MNLIKSFLGIKQEIYPPLSQPQILIDFTWAD
jgi:hypothetical protein